MDYSAPFQTASSSEFISRLLWYGYPSAVVFIAMLMLSRRSASVRRFVSLSNTLFAFGSLVLLLSWLFGYFMLWEEGYTYQQTGIAQEMFRQLMVITILNYGIPQIFWLRPLRGSYGLSLAFALCYNPFIPGLGFLYLRMLNFKQDFLPGLTSSISPPHWPVYLLTYGGIYLVILLGWYWLKRWQGRVGE